MCSKCYNFNFFLSEFIMSINLAQDSSSNSAELFFDKLDCINEFVLPENLSVPIDHISSQHAATKFPAQGLTGKQALCAILRISAKHIERNITNIVLSVYDQYIIVDEVLNVANNSIGNQLNQLQEQIKVLQQKLQAGNFPMSGQQPNFVPHPDTMYSQMQIPQQVPQGAGWIGMESSMAQRPMWQMQQPQHIGNQPPWANNMNINQGPAPAPWQQNPHRQPMRFPPHQQPPAPLGPQYYVSNIIGQIDALAAHYMNNGFITSENINDITSAIGDAVNKTTLPKDKVQMVMNSVTTLFSLTLHQFGDEKYIFTSQGIYVVNN